MRIISGSRKGRKIKAPKTGLRPLSDRAKEALFNILAVKTPDSKFLDLFAGSGSVGLEALSRGASIAFFVEKNRKSVDVIRQNIKDLDFDDRTEVYSMDVDHSLKIFRNNNAKFDIIFLGAPYGSPDLGSALEFLGECGIINPSGVIIAEHRFKSVLKKRIGHLEQFREERYGETIFSFYKEV